MINTAMKRREAEAPRAAKRLRVFILDSGSLPVLQLTYYLLHVSLPVYIVKHYLL
jgi:hypothetical protein